MRPWRSWPSIGFRIPILLVAVLGFSLSGCAYIIAGAVAFSPSGGGGRNVQKNQPPAISFPLTPLPSATDLFADIDYDLVDSQGDAVDIVVMFSTDQGANFVPATEGPGSNGTMGLSSSPTPGTPHIYVWNFFNDLFGNDIAQLQSLSFDVTLEFALTDAKGEPGTPDTVSFRVGNLPPTVVLQPIVDEVLLPTVIVDYRLIDDFSDLIDITVEFSQDKFSTPGRLASEVAGGSTQCPEGISQVTSSPSPGTDRCFEWAYSLDFLRAADPITLRFTVVDSAGAMSVASSNEFRVGNDAVHAARASGRTRSAESFGGRSRRV